MRKPSSGINEMQQIERKKSSWNISTTNMKLPLIISQKNRQWQPPSTCVSPTSGKLPVKPGEKCKDLYTAMPSRPFSFVTYMKEISWKNPFIYKDKHNHLRRSSIVYELTCTCGSNYIGQTRRNWINRINEHKFDQRSEVCKHLLANPKHRFNLKQPEILGSIVSEKELHLLEHFWYRATSQISTSTVHLCPYCCLTH